MGKSKMTRAEWRESLKTVRFKRIAKQNWFESWEFGNWRLYRYSDGPCIWVWMQAGWNKYGKTD